MENLNNAEDYILFEHKVSTSVWTKLRAMYKREFGKKFSSSCICNAKGLQSILKKKKGYVQ